jgi:small nuclear ribonucleoprotein (snRNP)-like protein
VLSPQLCRNNRKLLARVKAYDKHMNMVLENVRVRKSQIALCFAC